MGDGGFFDLHLGLGRLDLDHHWLLLFLGLWFWLLVIWFLFLSLLITLLLGWFLLLRIDKESRRRGHEHWLYNSRVVDQLGREVRRQDLFSVYGGSHEHWDWGLVGSLGCQSLLDQRGGCSLGLGF